MNGIVSGVHGYRHGIKPSLPFTWEDVQHTSDFLLSRTEHRPKIGVICGSGLGGLVDMLSDTQALGYQHIPHFPISTAPGHAGRLVFGSLAGKPCVCMQGRVHMYEGYPVWKVTFPVRVMKAMGVQVLLITNAAGGLNETFKTGDLMIIKDHINLPGLTGLNPLLGPNDDNIGPRFPAMSDAYDTELRKIAHTAAKSLGLCQFLHEGVYVVQSGPCYETVAECRMLRMMGADVTGMSTVPEVISARHCGLRVFAMSLVTNMCVMDIESEEVANSDEVLEIGQKRSKETQRLISKMIEMINV